MSRLVTIAVAVCLLAPGDASAKRRKGRKGKVVRVERVTRQARKQPRVLQVASQTQLISYGWQPEIGLEVALLDLEGLAAHARVTGVTERAGTCQTGLFVLEFEVDEWVRAFNYNNMYGVTGLDLEDEARSIRVAGTGPTGNPQEYVWTGIDREGDGTEDMIVTSYPCADTETPGATIGSMTMSPHCMDAYTRKSPDAPWERATHDVWYQCP